MDRRSAIGLVAAGLTQPVVHATEPKPPQRPILVIAAAARTAPEILSQALAQGRGVTALARHPERIAVRSPPLRIVTGDVFDIDSRSRFERPEIDDALVGHSPAPPFVENRIMAFEPTGNIIGI